MLCKVWTKTSHVVGFSGLIRTSKNVFIEIFNIGCVSSQEIHSARILLTLHFFSGVCYVTKAKYIDYAIKEWEERTNNAIVDYIVVSQLPRGALIEWHVWAHRHNNQFECMSVLFAFIVK